MYIIYTSVWQTAPHLQNVELPHAHTANRHALDLNFLKLSSEKVSEYDYIKQCVRSPKNAPTHCRAIWAVRQ